MDCSQELTEEVGVRRAPVTDHELGCQEVETIVANVQVMYQGARDAEGSGVRGKYNFLAQQVSRVN